MAQNKRPNTGKPAAPSYVQYPAQKSQDIDVPARPKFIEPTNPLLRKAFYGSIGFMLLFLLIAGWNVGYHQDEIDMNAYGKANYAYYSSHGKVKDYYGNAKKGDERVDSVLRYYGSAFEYLPVGFNKLAHLEDTPNEFNVRHVFIHIVAILLVLFTGLVARKLGGWRTALFTIWLLYLTPAFFGASMFNSKDIPFAAGYIASIYFIICFLEEMPTPTWRTSLYLILASAFTVGTRIGGLLIHIYFGMFIVMYVVESLNMYKAEPKKLLPIAIKASTVVVVCMTLVVVTWPFLLTDPFKHILEAFNVVKKFPTIVKMSFDGVYGDSTKIPWYYLPKFMAITVPIMVLVAILLGAMTSVRKFRFYNWKITSIILFTSIFPIVYAVVTQVSLYSQWRHFLFVFPGLCIIGGLGLSDLADNFGKPAFKWAVVGICALGMVKPVAWMMKNHPLEYTYFNEFAGGFEKAYYEYENDYWEISLKGAIDWLVKNEPAITNSKDTILIATNAENFTRHYFHVNYPQARVKAVSIGVLTRYGQQWTYALYSNIFLRPEYLENYFPLCNTVHAETVDGLPVLAVLKDTERVDWKAQQAFAKSNYPLADSLLSYYLTKVCPTNVGLYGLMSLIRADMNNSADGIKYGNQCLSYNISPFANYDALCGLGVAYGNLRQFDSSITKLRQAISMFPNFESAPNILKQVLNYQQKLKQDGQLGVPLPIPGQAPAQGQAPQQGQAPLPGQK